MRVTANNEITDLPEKSTLADLVAIMDEKLQYGDRGMCVLNGVLCVNNNIPLKESDVVSYFPTLEGG